MNFLQEVAGRVPEVTKRRPHLPRWLIPKSARREEDVVDLRGEVLAILRSNTPQLIRAFKANGDNYLSQWARRTVLQRLMQEEGIPGEYPLYQVGAFDNIEDFKNPPFALQEVLRKIEIKNPKRDGQHYTSWELSVLAKTLGVTLPPEDYLRAPQPHRENSGPLKKFSVEIMIHRGREIRSRLQTVGSPVFCIAQGGSSETKRFSDRQVDFISQFLREKYPKCAICVVTDKAFRNNKLDRDYSQSEISLVTQTQSINEICGTFYAADVIIATDSFFSHLGAGCRVMRDRPDGILLPSDMYVLHTIADISDWGVPGATCVASEALQQVTGRVGAGQMNQATYRSYYGFSAELLETEGIADKDVMNLLDLL